MGAARTVLKGILMVLAGRRAVLGAVFGMACDCQNQAPHQSTGVTLFLGLED